MNEIIPEIIYHYTTADGLHSIISHNQIWATDIEFLNDAKYTKCKEARDEERGTTFGYLFTLQEITKNILDSVLNG